MDPETETYSPAVERAAELLIHEAETTGLIREDVRNGLAAALDVEEMACALYLSDYPYNTAEQWRDLGSERAKGIYRTLAHAIRTAILGSDS